MASHRYSRQSKSLAAVDLPVSFIDRRYITWTRLTDLRDIALRYLRTSLHEGFHRLNLAVNDEPSDCRWGRFEMLPSASYQPLMSIFEFDWHVYIEATFVPSERSAGDGYEWLGVNASKSSSDPTEINR
jgi:hypothetical protein